MSFCRLGGTCSRIHDSPWSCWKNKGRKAACIGSLHHVRGLLIPFPSIIHSHFPELALYGSGEGWFIVRVANKPIMQKCLPEQAARDYISVHLRKYVRGPCRLHEVIPDVMP